MFENIAKSMNKNVLVEIELLNEQERQRHRSMILRNIESCECVK